MAYHTKPFPTGVYLGRWENGVGYFLGVRRIGRGLIPPQDNPAFARGKGISVNLFDKLSCPYHHLTHYRTISNMSRLPTAYGESSLGGSHRCYGTSHTCADNTTNNARGNSNTNSANVSNSGSSTVSVGINKESLQIQE